jgi:hypothetical protein
MFLYCTDVTRQTKLKYVSATEVLDYLLFKYQNVFLHISNEFLVMSVIAIDYL